jgi:tetratricopeptide (TPR) repeat protein
MSVERQWLRAQQYIASNQITAARITLESLLQRDPARTDARMLLASAILNEGRVREAAAHAIAASNRLPDDADAVGATAHCLLRLGEMVAARDCLNRPGATDTNDGRMLTVLAHAQQKLGDHRAALALMDRAQATGYNTADFHYYRGLQLQFNGRIAEAERELEESFRLGLTVGLAAWTLARMRKQTPESNHLEQIRKQLQTVERGSEDHAAFEFAQFKELEDLGEYDEAFAALARGNALMYARQHHDIAREQALFDKLIAHTPAERLRPHTTPFDGPQPIFIVGMPRSGTTLLDRILDNHPLVVSTGERDDFPRQLRWCADRYAQQLIDEPLIDELDRLDYAELGRRYLAQTQWRAQGKPYFLDKLPSNALLVGLIHRALPKAPILHMVRDPMDVCFSNYKALFGGTHRYSYDLHALAAHYGQYRRLMQHWHTALPGRIYDVNYSELVRQPNAIVPNILHYCGLPDEPGCTDLSRNKTAVSTLSSAQVREPIHTRTLGEWRRYERQLAPLQAALQAWINDSGQ